MEIDPRFFRVRCGMPECSSVERMCLCPLCPPNILSASNWATDISFPLTIMSFQKADVRRGLLRLRFRCTRALLSCNGSNPEFTFFRLSREERREEQNNQWLSLDFFHIWFRSSLFCLWVPCYHNDTSHVLRILRPSIVVTSWSMVQFCKIHYWNWSGVLRFYRTLAGCWWWRL